MSNDATTLNGFLDTALNDASDTVWTSTEKDNVLSRAVASLWPRLSVEVDPTANTITLLASTYSYALPGTYIGAVSKLFLVDTSSIEAGFLDKGSWELIGSPFTGTPKLHISQTIVDNNVGATIRVYGYQRFQISAAPYIPDEYVPLVLSVARAELLRRMVTDRSRFQVWLSRQQTQNISVNEGLQMVGEAQQEAQRERAQFKIWQRPVAARV